ncbi:MAG: I78 family peptidase inhibitor [Pseudomonadota bacterium]
MKIVAGLLAVIVAAGCAPIPSPNPSPLSGQCHVGRVKGLIGRPATVATVDEARRKAGAGIARGIGPGMRVTMDYRSGRLNVWIDTNGRIERFSCG